MMFTGVPILTGYLLISYAHFSHVTEHFVFILYTGRLLTGVGMGSASASICVSITERVLQHKSYRNVFACCTHHHATVTLHSNSPGKVYCIIRQMSLTETVYSVTSK